MAENVARQFAETVAEDRSRIYLSRNSLRDKLHEKLHSVTAPVNKHKYLEESNPTVGRKTGCLFSKFRRVDDLGITQI